MVPDWSLLPFDIMLQVGQHFESPEDIITFSAVSRDWEDVSTVLKTIWNPKIPWILLPEPGEDMVKLRERIDLRDESVNMNLIIDNRHPHNENPECIRSLLDPLTSKIYRLKLPQLCGRKCFFSPCGWLLTIGLDFQISLFNPLTKSQLSLPPQWTMPNPDLDLQSLSEWGRIWIRSNYLEKALLFKLSDKNDVTTFIVMAVKSDDWSLAFARPGDYAWTAVKTKAVADVVYWRGVFLILHDSGKMSYFDYVDTLLSKSPVVTKVYQNCPEQQVTEAKSHFPCFFGLYLLQAYGDLYVICRNRVGSGSEGNGRGDGNGSGDDNYLPYKTVLFRVFKLNVDHHSRKWEEVKDIKRNWEEVKDIKGMAFFVGNGSCIHSNLSQRNMSWESNSINFMDDADELHDSHNKRGGGHDMGIYNIKTMDFKDIYSGDDMFSRFCAPLFFKPSF